MKSKSSFSLILCQITLLLAYSMIWNISAFEMSENSKKIDKLLRLAKDLDEPSFQRKSQYQSFKVKKHIQPDDVQQFIAGSICTIYN